MPFALKQHAEPGKPALFEKPWQLLGQRARLTLTIAVTLSFPLALHATDLKQVQLLLDGKHYAQALALIDADIAEAAGNKAELLFVRARVIAASGELEMAERAYRELITRYPGRPEPYNNLARLYSQQGKLEQAAALLRAGLYTDPTYRVLFDNLTRVYVEQAGRSWRGTINPQDPDANPDRPLTTLGELHQLPSSPAKP